MNIKAFCASLLLLGWTGTGAVAQEAAAPEKNQIAVNVLGAVNKPSRYLLPTGATVLDALASAGDIKTGGNRVSVRLIHVTAADKPDVSIIDVASMLKGLRKAEALRDGDTLVFPERTFSVSY